MRFHKAELFFFLLMVLVVVSGLFSFAGYSAATGGFVVGGIETAANFAFMGSVMAGLSAVCGFMLVYPIMSRGLRERGKLQKMTESLSVRSLSLEHAAVTDSLTGMYNRRYFDDALAEYLEAFGHINKPIGMVILDLDHFKKVNDTHGHDVGDKVLREVAECLQVFTRYHDVLARLGGEEFAILSPNITEQQLYSLSDRIRQAVSELRIVNGNVTLKVTVSAGLAIWDGAETGEELYRRADKQLYEAKRQGRNRVCAA
ncbi:MAG: GGDEF domain-containing protein [Hoeflea sp.]|uniref:GGDEF domain-containing protein n=1 Tax=Hoeflea sp. TaxID=1940281 RepID=UPI000C0EF45D|nr:GGDEF domain-containing protein [Hoeflea sp.]PHR25674.1 MAG: GGDEF domain-containing protein [Hoeflea sp.]|tara:strand:+ start:35849 stop:36622 length:774 start_codon:yes stop_codon:yes gene_type:complete